MSAPVLYLASKSPRRRQILASMGITNIEVIIAGKTQRTAYEGDEEQLPGESPADYVVRTAQTKARYALSILQEKALPPAPVLAADTVVVANGVILGKPRGKAEARRFMQILSGAVHEVRTAAVVATPIELLTAVSVSLVSFAPLSDEVIERYIATEEPYDKAGGYGIQGLAGQFICRIEGSYTGIMGLPVFETAGLLRPFGLTAI